MILKWVIEREREREREREEGLEWIGSIWLRIGTSGGFL
jgi:hypothetical protein